MFINLKWDVKEPTYYSKRAGHEVPGVVAVLCECMDGYREGDMPRMGLSVPFAHHLALLCKNCIEFTRCRQHRYELCGKMDIPYQSESYFTNKAEMSGLKEVLKSKTYDPKPYIH